MSKFNINIAYYNLFQVLISLYIVNHYVACFYFNNFDGTNLIDTWIDSNDLVDSSLG